MKLLLLVFSFLVIFSSNAFAVKENASTDGKKMDDMLYAPEYCEFSATFPEQAYLSRRCEDASKKNCYDLVSFTKVFDLSATVRVDIICNPSTPEMYEQLNKEAMETTVKAMTKNSVIETYNINSRQEPTFRQTGLLGKGHEGVQDTIYIAQLWSGKKSMMSVEAQLIGEPLPEADELFADILRSIGYFPESENKESPEDESKSQDQSETNKADAVENGDEKATKSDDTLDNDQTKSTLKGKKIKIMVEQSP